MTKLRGKFPYYLFWQSLEVVSQEIITETKFTSNHQKKEIFPPKTLLFLSSSSCDRFRWMKWSWRTSRSRRHARSSPRLVKCRWNARTTSNKILNGRRRFESRLIKGIIIITCKSIINKLELRTRGHNQILV